MTTSEQIIRDLALIANVGETVELLNLYQELPIVNKAAFEKIEGDAITFATHRHQLTCIEIDRRTILLSDIMQVAISAELVSLDKAAGMVTLTHFAPLNQQVGDRLTVRVAPQIPYPVILTTEGRQAPASLADITIHGLGLRLPSAEIHLTRKQPVQLLFQLPNGPISLAGEVRYIKQEGEGYRVGVDFSQEVRMKALIAQYISGRRAEILEELDAA